MNSFIKILTVAIIIIALGSLGIMSLNLFYRNKILKQQLSEAKMILKKAQEELNNAQEDKEKLTKENEKLQSDAVSYVGINAKLKEEKDKLQKVLDETQNIINSKEGSAQRAKRELDLSEKRIRKEIAQKEQELELEKEKLQKRINELEQTLNSERALYHYNLAVAYNQAGLFDEAIDSYQRSLDFDKNNAEAYYNLGLIYQNSKKNTDDAKRCFKKYLELKPDAEDKDEVMGWLNKQG